VAMADALTRAPQGDSVLVGVIQRSNLQWIGRGPTLTRYAVRVLHTDSLPPAADIRCPELRRREGSAGRATLIGLSVTCGSLAHPDVVVVRRFRFASWLPPGLVDDSVRADIRFGSRPP
jgi:hypothetical protein